jgi:hypothetical protein
MRCVLSSAILLAAAVAASLPGSAIAAGIATEWDFTTGDLTASSGPLSMSYWGTLTSDSVSFVDETVAGESKKVMQCPAFDSGQALAVDAGVVLNYTLIWDIKVPSSTANGYGSLLNTDTNNSADATFVIRKDGSTGSIGTQGVYAGPVTYDAWHRIALTVADTGAGGSEVTSYIDGSLASSHIFTGSQNKYPLSSGLLLLADNDGETEACSLSAVYVADSVLNGTAIAALGGVSAAGIHPVPEPGAIALVVTGVLSLLAYAWRRRR